MTASIFTQRLCPILSESAQPPTNCPILRCMHNARGACKIRAPLDEDLDAVSEAFGTTRDDILNRVDFIQRAIVAQRWFEEVTRRTITTGTHSNFDEATDPRQERNFKDWNSSNYTFVQIVATLRYILSIL